MSSKIDRLKRRASLLAKAREAAREKRKTALRVGRESKTALPAEEKQGDSAPSFPRLVVSSDPIQKKRERSRLLGNPGEYTEIRRIVQLPIIPRFDKQDVQEFCKANVLSAAYREGFRLWPVQCQAIHAYQTFGGLFAPIGVGWGKTLITQAVANHAYKSGIKKIVLMVPSQVLTQLVKVDFPYARRRIPITYPIHVLGGMSKQARRMICRSGKKGLYIFPYSLISKPDAWENLQLIRPELIIADEADKLGNPRSARTKRVMSYVRESEPQGATLSGTITGTTIKDYYHLIKWCLRLNCPLPLSGNLASEWATKIDAAATSSKATGPIVPLVEWAQENFPAHEITEDVTGFRTAYRLRLKTAPGVAATGDADIGPSLVINNLPVKNYEESDGWGELERLREQVVSSYLTPNLDEIEHAIHTYKWLYELTSGFYNELTFPAEDLYAEREGVTVAQAEEILELARDYHGAGQAYSSMLRSWIEAEGRQHLDTPLLVGLDMSKHGPKNVGPELYSLWRDHKDLEEELRQLVLQHKAHKGTDKELKKKLSRSLRDSRVVRVCDYKISHAVKWAQSLKKKGGIIWVHHRGIGEWVTEALTEAGLDPLYCPAGDPYNDMILDPKNAKRKIVASMRGHGTGKNLQAFHEQLFLQWPRNAKMAEQALGRMHRNGQTNSTVWAHTNRTTEFDLLCFAASLNDSLYIHQTTGNRQKLIYATYSPGLPKVYSSEFLRERGFQNKKLDPKQQKMMSERFAG